MNFNQNEKIDQIHFGTLIVGVDIGKGKHIARAVDDRGKELAKPLAFTNTKKGFDQLLFWIRTIQKSHSKQHVLFGMEPTGHYWLNLAYFLKRHKIKVVVVNPFHVHRTKELDDNSPTKNDVKDAYVIARLIQGARYSEAYLPEDTFADLRTAMKMRDQLSKDLIRMEGRVHRWLDQYFPEFLTVFKDWKGKTATQSLRHFPLPSDVQRRSVEQIVEIWKQKVQRSVGLKRAERLMEAAEHSIGLNIGLEMARMEIQFLLQQVEMIQQQLNLLDEQIKMLLDNIPGTQEMQSVPGVSFLTVAGFLAEVGDLKRYVHPRQIQKLAGLNLKEYSSGKHKGKTYITKRGRSQLRALLYRSILPLVAKNPEFKAFHEYYVSRRKNPLRRKQSLIALCCKLIRILFVIGISKVPYNPAKLREALRIAQHGNAA
jgi:transposase